MRLSELIKDLEVKKTIGDLQLEINNIAIDSGAVTKGDLFICIKGKDFDGHDFIKEAINHGAVAVVCEKEVSVTKPQIIVKSARRALSALSANLFNRTENDIKLIGVIGTNGKTTTSHLIKEIIEDSGISAGVIGTLGTYFGDQKYETALTTPDPIELHKILYEMSRSGVKVAVMEVSSSKMR